MFSVLRVLPLPSRVAGLLEAESGFNDAPSVILVTLLSATPFHLRPAICSRRWPTSWPSARRSGSSSDSLGALALPRVALPASGLYPLATFALGMVGFAGRPVQPTPAVSWPPYLAGVVLANAGLPHRAATRSFAEGLGWLAQIGLFVVLGLLVTPSELIHQVVPAIVVGLVLLVAARPLAVVGSLIAFRIPIREQVFLSWAGLRGAVPIVLATFPIVEGVPHSRRLLNIVFVLVVIYTLVQGPSLAWVARALGLVPRDATRELLVEAAPLDVLDSELLTTTVAAGSRLHSVSITELRLPDPSVISLIIREGRTFVPSAETQLRTAMSCSSSPPGRSATPPNGACARSAGVARSRIGSTSTARPSSPVSARDDRRELGLGDPHQVGRSRAPPAARACRRTRTRCRTRSPTRRRRRQPGLLPDRGDAADDVAGGPGGRRRLGQLGPLAPSAAASALRSSRPATGTTAHTSFPSTAAIRVLKIRAGSTPRAAAASSP